VAPQGGSEAARMVFLEEKKLGQCCEASGLALTGHGLKTVHRTVFLTAFRRRFAPPHQLHRDGTTVIDSSSKLRNKKKKQVF